MRNIKRVILWELPPSFCALVQRAGRAGRDMTTLGEAILIVSPNVITKGTTEMEVEEALAEVAKTTEAENRGDDEIAALESNGIQVVDAGGVRVGAGSDTSDDEETTPELKETQKKRRKQTKKRLQFTGGQVLDTICVHY